MARSGAATRRVARPSTAQAPKTAGDRNRRPAECGGSCGAKRRHTALFGSFRCSESLGRSNARKCKNPGKNRVFPRSFARGAGRIRTGDGGFAIRCLSHLATAPWIVLDGCRRKAWAASSGWPDWSPQQMAAKSQPLAKKASIAQPARTFHLHRRIKVSIPAVKMRRAVAGFPAGARPVCQYRLRGPLRLRTICRPGRFAGLGQPSRQAGANARNLWGKQKTPAVTQRAAGHGAGGESAVSAVSRGR